MRAVVVRSGRLVVEDVPAPKPGPGQVVIRVRACAICGSDLHALAAGWLPDGAILGHEFAGEVAEVGEGVVNLASGDRVTSFPVMPCGSCAACRSGATANCTHGTTIGLGSAQGGLAEDVLSHASVVYRLPDALPFDVAAACEPLTVALYAVHDSGIRCGETAAVLGAGPIGLFVLQCLRVAGVADIRVIEPNPARRALAQRLGATAVYDPRADDPRAAILEATVVGPDVVFDCAGAPGTLQTAAELVRRGGVVQLVGVNMGEEQIVALPWILREIEVRGSLGGRREFPQALQLLAEGRVDVAAMTTRIVGLDSVPETFAALARHDTTDAFVVVRPAEA